MLLYYKVLLCFVYFVRVYFTQVLSNTHRKS